MEEPDDIYPRLLSRKEPIPWGPNVYKDPVKWDMRTYVPEQTPVLVL